MFRPRMGFAAFVVPAILGTSGLVFTGGCQNKMHDENLAFHRQNNELQSRNRELEDQMKGQQDSQAQLQQMQQELAAPDAKIAELQNQLRTPTPAPTGQPAPQPANSLAGHDIPRHERPRTMKA